MTESSPSGGFFDGRQLGYGYPDVSKIQRILTANQWEWFESFVLQDKSVKTIASMHGVTENAVKNWGEFGEAEDSENVEERKYVGEGWFFIGWNGTKVQQLHPDKKIQKHYKLIINMYLTILWEPLLTRIEHVKIMSRIVSLQRTLKL